MSSTFRTVFWCAAMSLVARAGFTVGQMENPYQAIAARNVFNLVAVPLHLPPRAEQTPKRKPPRMMVTGLTDVCGRPQALLELGEGPNAVRKPILAEGESSQGVHVLEIDVRAGSVKVAFEGQSTVLSLNNR